MRINKSPMFAIAFATLISSGLGLPSPKNTFLPNEARASVPVPLTPCPRPLFTPNLTPSLAGAIGVPHREPEVRDQHGGTIEPARLDAAASGLRATLTGR